jgi:cardiolipin synthase (CMP-forming)
MARAPMLNLPNAITLLRLGLVPLIGWQLYRGEADITFWLFIVSALSDWADGFLARRWQQQTRFGAVADPLADKLTMFTVTMLLTLQHALPLWFALALVLRDLLIVGGALAFRLVIGQLEMAPTRLSKLNTALQFLLLLTVLAERAGAVPGGRWLDILLTATFVTIVLSGAQYVVVWGGKALRARGQGTAQR